MKCEKILILALGLIASLPLVASASVPLSATEVNPIEVGSTVPEATLYSAEGESIELSELLSGQAAVIVFYRGGWCPYCTRHLSALAEIESKIRSQGYRIIAISPDRPEKIVETGESDDFGYELYSDSSMEVAMAFGLAFKLDAPTLEKLDGYGIDVEAASGQDHHLLPVPAVFVVDQSGLVSFRYHNPDYRERLTSEALMKAIR
jgi:peroxiredoxin